MRTSRSIFAVVALVVAAGLLAGCRAEEQGRELLYNKGNYSGPMDPELTPKQIDELNARVMLQGGPNAGIAPGAPPPPVRASQTTPDAAPPPAPTPATPVNETELNNRLRQQSGN